MAKELTRAQKLELLALLEEKQRRQFVYRYRQFGEKLYPFQRKLIATTATHSQVCLMAANRVGKCVTERTVISTPHGDVFVRDLIESSGGDVYAWDGERVVHAKAKAPFSKGLHDTFMIETSSGFFEAADYHRVLVCGQWCFPLEFASLFEDLHTLVERHLLSSLACDPLAHVSSAESLKRKAEDFQSCYSEDFHLCDEQPPIVKGSDKDDFPSVADALLRILAWCALGDLVRKDTDTLSQSLRHLSSLGDRRQIAALFFEFLLQYGSKLFEQNSETLRAIRLLNAAASSRLQSTGELLLQVAGECVCGNVPLLSSSIESNKIVSACYIGVHEVFDFEVEDCHNYISGGFVHHNTMTGTYIDAIHALGDYPDWWDGHRFEHAPLIWCLGYSGEKTRDLLQEPIFGRRQDDSWIGGLIPPERIIGHEAMTGTPNAMRTVYVKHASGGTTKVQFWSYSQGQHAIMGDSVDWFHIDEEPKDQTIYPQVLTRTATGDRGNGGRGILTFTPENGRTDLVIGFMDNPAPGQVMINAGWDDAPHLTQEVKETLLASFPAHQRDMRTKGIPMLGHGRIYDLAEDYITCDSFDIPPHWFIIDGMDFGWDHPQAHVQLAWDADSDCYYVVQAYKQSRISPIEAWGAVKRWAEDVPTAWPLDGLQTEKGSGKQQRDYYQEAGFNMVYEHATWPDGGNGVEAGLFEILDLMRKGKFKVFRGLRDWFSEFLQYHRDERGRIVKTGDDLMDATRYAYMMRRYAVRRGDVGRNDVSSVYVPPAMTTW